MVWPVPCAKPSLSTQNGPANAWLYQLLTHSRPLGSGRAVVFVIRMTVSSRKTWTSITDVCLNVGGGGPALDRSGPVEHAWIASPAQASTTGAAQRVKVI